MCLDPISAATLAISAASSVAGFAQKQQEADAQNARYKQNYINSLAAARDNQRQLTDRQMQEQEATAQKDHQVLVEGAQRAADVSVSAAGGGVAGLSVDSLIADVGRNVALNRANLARNYEMTAAQLQEQKIATVTTAESRINSVAQASSPSFAGTALEIAGAGIKAYGSSTRGGG